MLTWLVLTWLSLYTHPTTTTHHCNSTSTRNNDPRSLKFCKRPYQAKLTIIQHNFNPTTIFWGGGSYILHLGWPYIVFFFDKKKLDPNLFNQNFLPKIFFDLTFFLPKIFFTEIFWQKIVYQKFLLTQKFL